MKRAVRSIQNSENSTRNESVLPTEYRATITIVRSFRIDSMGTKSWSKRERDREFSVKRITIAVTQNRYGYLTNNAICHASISIADKKRERGREGREREGRREGKRKHAGGESDSRPFGNRVQPRCDNLLIEIFVRRNVSPSRATLDAR